MHLDSLFPLTTHQDEEMDRSSASISEEENRSPRQQVDDNALKKKHRRGKKRNRPKWKPYSKMTLEERKQLDEWEADRVVKREAEINARSMRPVAPFNSTQFLMDDRGETQVRTPSSSHLARTISYDSSSSGGVSGHVLVAGLLTPPSSDSEICLSPIPFFPLIRLGDEVQYDPSDEDLQEQEAFLTADFDQVYIQLRMNRLEGMSKQDLIDQCYNLEDRVSAVEQEKIELLEKLHDLQKANGELTEENSELKKSALTSH